MEFRGTFSWPFFVLFFVFSVLVVWLVGKNVVVLARFVRTTGTVGGSEYIEAEERGKVGVYQQEVVFLVDDKPYRAKLTVRSNPPQYASGDQVPVYYDARDPNQARVGTFSDLWLGPLAVGGFWFIFFILWFGTWVGSPPRGN